MRMQPVLIETKFWSIYRNLCILSLWCGVHIVDDITSFVELVWIYQNQQDIKLKFLFQYNNDEAIEKKASSSNAFQPIGPV